MAAGGKNAWHGEVWRTYQTYLLKREKTLQVRNWNIVRNILMRRRASHFMNLHNPFIGKCLILHVDYNSRFSDNFTMPRVTLQRSQYFYIAIFNLKKFCLLEYNAVYSSESQLVFQRNIVPRFSCWFLAWCALQRWRWRHCLLPNCNLTVLHSVISQKIELFIVTTVWTSDLTYI
jgi:hypothetical protein